ncbi:MAG: hypothetical protein WD314_08330 [Trueperaceae bacterium]
MKHTDRINVGDVFVPGGLPRYTYVERNETQLEEKLRRAIQFSRKLVTVTGATKSGKTVLARTILPEGDAIWLDGGTYSNEDEFWGDVLQKLGEFTALIVEEVRGKTTTATSGANGGFGIPGVASLGGKIEAGHGDSLTSSTSRGRTEAVKPAAVRALRVAKAPMIIDDFHYVGRDTQAQVVRALKPLIFDGVAVIALAIPHRRFDAVRVEREMTGRVEQVEVPAWALDELLEISAKGFTILGLEVQQDVQDAFAREAFGSPHLMQEFCLELCVRRGIELAQVSPVTLHVEQAEQIAVFRSVAEATGKTMFERLSRGPRQRTDRIQRSLSDGFVTDIYGLVLKALANMQPGIETIDYEQLRASIRETAAGEIPQAHEVSRVLDHMAQIAADDEASTPVIDWDREDRRLHITDPFFAYYLRWGDTSVGQVRVEP